MSARQLIYISPTGQLIELGDDSISHNISVQGGSQRRGVESRQIAGADYQQQINHGNKVNTITWQVERDHSTVAVAVAFMRDHADNIPTDAGIAAGILQETGDDGSVRFLQNCSIEAIEWVRWDGQTTVYKYTARGGAWTDTVNGV